MTSKTNGVARSRGGARSAASASSVRAVEPALSSYRRKRDFSRTAEPSGEAEIAASDGLRYVIQKHAASHLHFDLRLEVDGVFKSWAVTKGPSTDPSQKRLAVQVEDHPLEYGDFEGTIPKGQYGGGTVMLWDRGHWSPEGEKTPQAALASGELKFSLEGTRLHGSWVLVRMKKDRIGNERINWLLIKHRDEAAQVRGADKLLRSDRSVASGRSMREIAAGVEKTPTSAQRRKPKKPPKAASAEPMPRFVEPQLCKLVDRPPSADDWVHEVKFDGYRAQLRVENGVAVVRTRRGLDWTAAFARIAEAAQELPDCLIDGEIVALDQQRIPSFAALQVALAEGSSDNLTLFAFDLLFERGEDLRNLALSERKSRLERLLKTCADTHLRYVQHFEAHADAVLSSACTMALEGIVSKRLNSPYVSGRTGAWTKAKCRAGHEVVLGGWTLEGSKFRSLLAGVNRDGHLVYVGRIGTGYGGKVAAQLLPKLRALTRDRSPFGGANAPRKAPEVRWLKPTLVAEIEFAGWTGSGMIRQASFKGLRQDKLASDVIAELPAPLPPDDIAPTQELEAKLSRSARRTKPGGAAARAAAPSRMPNPPTRVAGPVSVMGVPISKPDKSLWPDAGDRQPVTKLDLARYFEDIGDWMLPHVAGRPCSLLRAPDGVGGEQFFQRHAMAGMSTLLDVVKVRGDRAPYVRIDRIEALAAAAQLGALEIHPWNCVPGNPEVAGRLIFDLDPAPDVAFDAVIKAALEIRDRLKAVGLETFCKTTGGKGLHVVTPLTLGRIPWAAAKNFAHIICAQMVEDSPQRYVDVMSKRQRVGKIFLDYLRNDRTATAVAVLSPRARAGATVSMPIDWNRVRRGLDPKSFTLRSAPGLLRKGRAWEGYHQAARSLAAAIRSVSKSRSTAA